MTEQPPRPDDEQGDEKAPADPPSWPAPAQPGAEQEPTPHEPTEQPTEQPTTGGTSDAAGYPYAGGNPTVPLSKDAPPAAAPTPYGPPDAQPAQAQYGQPQYGQPAPYAGGGAYGAPAPGYSGGYAGGPGYGQPSPPTPTSTVVLLVLSGIATLSFFLSLAGIVPLIMSIVALTKNRQDPEGAKRLTRIGWWVLIGLTVLGIVLLIGFFALIAMSSPSSSFDTTY